MKTKLNEFFNESLNNSNQLLGKRRAIFDDYGFSNILYYSFPHKPNT